jgi:hypothetical protein
MSNGTRLFWTLLANEENAKRRMCANVTVEQYAECEARIERALAPLQAARMSRVDTSLIIDEFRNAAAMLRHACHRGQFLRGGQSMRDQNRLVPQTEQLSDKVRQLIQAHRWLWLARNREGGLGDSVGRLEGMLDDYTGRA